MGCQHYSGLIRGETLVKSFTNIIALNVNDKMWVLVSNTSIVLMG